MPTRSDERLKRSATELLFGTRQLSPKHVADLCETTPAVQHGVEHYFLSKATPGLSSMGEGQKCA